MPPEPTSNQAPLVTRARSLAEWDLILARYPLGSRGDLWRAIAFCLASNLLVWRFIVSGRMRPTHVVVLVALEAVLLSSLAWIQSRLVPAAARMERPQPLAARLGTFAFAFVWLGFVYGLVLGLFVDDGATLVALRDDPLGALATGGLLWPLALTAAGAVADAIADWTFWRRHGGLFLSTPGVQAIARWLTLFLGGIPFFVPMVAGAFGVVTLAERVAKRRAGSSRPDRPRLPVRAEPLFAPLLLLAVFGPMAWLLASGINGWAVGYCSAKFASEVFVLCLPLVASRARAEETAKIR